MLQLLLHNMELMEAAVNRIYNILDFVALEKKNGDLFVLFLEGVVEQNWQHLEHTMEDIG